MTAVSRRTILHRAAALGLAVPALTAFAPTARSHAAERDYTLVEAYDWMQAEVDATMVVGNNETGLMAWYTAWALQSYLVMYRATGDTKYLDLVVRDGDATLAQRDRDRGVVDFRGLSTATWRTGHMYATEAITLRGPGGLALFRLRIGLMGSNSAKGDCTVSPGTRPHHFTLRVTNALRSRTDTYQDLSLDPSSPDYVVTRLYWEQPNLTRCTAVDLRDVKQATDVPATGDFMLDPEFYANPVDTGQMTRSIGEFAAIVANDSSLSAYRPVAERYATATADALDAHDADWRQDSAGEGWYVAASDAPTQYAGADVPHNHQALLAMCHLHLHNAGGAGMHRDRAERLLRRIRNDMVRTPEDALTWRYWHTESPAFLGWTREDRISTRIPYAQGYQPYEDLGHATLDIDAMVVAHRNGAVFTAADLARLARTYSVLMARDPMITPVHANYVNGTGNGTDYLCGRMAALSPWDPTIGDFAATVFNRRQFSPHPSILHSLAHLVAAHRAGPRARDRRQRRRRG